MFFCSTSGIQRTRESNSGNTFSFKTVVATVGVVVLAGIVWALVSSRDASSDGGHDAAFKRLASMKEESLRDACKSESFELIGFRNGVEGDIGTIEFVTHSELDLSAIPGEGRIIDIDIGWRANYRFRGGEWSYEKCRRQVQTDDGRTVWKSADSGNSNAATRRIVQALEFD